MNEILEINGKILDLEPGNVTRQIRVSDIADIASRRSSYSSQFKIRKTANNIRIFEALGVPGTGTRKPYKITRANYSVGTIPLVVNGILTIESEDENFYSVRLRDGLLSLAQKMEGFTLQDLPLSEFNHFLNSETLIESFNNTEGYIYALADFGKGYSKTEFWEPSVFCSTLWKKAFDLIGVSQNAPFLDTDEDFQSEVVAPSFGIVKEDSSLTVTPRGSAAGNQSIFETSRSEIIIEEKISLTASGLNGFSLSDGELVSSIDSNLRLDLNATYTTNEGRSYLVIKRNGSVRYTAYLTPGSSINRQISLKVEPGDKISAYLKGESYIPSEDFGYYSVNSSIDLDFDLETTSGGVLVDVASVLPKVPLKEFVSDVMNRFGLYIYSIDDDNQIYEFKRLEKLLGSRATAIDWTRKVAGKASFGYTPPISQNNKFQFSYPKDVTSLANDGVLHVENENLDLESTVYKSFFEIPNRLGQRSGEPVYSIPIFSDDKDGNVQGEETAPKLMRVKKVNSVLTVVYFSEPSETFSGDVPCLSLEKIDMQFYISNHYSQYSAVLNTYKEISLPVNLSPIDIYFLRFDRLYYFEQFGRFYYLNSVRYSAGRTSTANLTEIPEFVTNSAPDFIGDYNFNLGNSGTVTINKSRLIEFFSDREFDGPNMVKISSGFNPEVKIYQKGVEITSETEIPYSDLELSFEDVDGSITERNYSFEFNISDLGSGNYSPTPGSININVREYVPAPVQAYAGPDTSIEIKPDGSEAPLYFVRLDGSGSFSRDEIVSYSWEIISAPNFSIAYIENSGKYSRFEIQPAQKNVGVYVIRLTATSEFGVSDIDDIQITVNQKNEFSG